MHVSQRQIARELNVSVATVSRSLSDSTRISDATRRRVREAAARLGYAGLGTGSRGSRPELAPDADASNRGERRAKMMGALVQTDDPTLQNWAGFVRYRYLHGASAAAQELGVAVGVHFVGRAERDRVAEPDHQPAGMRRGQFGGALLIGHFPEDQIARLAEALPCVRVGFRHPQIAVDCVDKDELHGITLAVDHLHGLGHRRIGFVGDRQHESYMHARFAAYTDQVLEHGLEFTGEQIINVSREALGDQCVAERVAAQVQRGVRAWVCGNDAVGYHLVQGLLGRGLRVPEDVSVVGVDDIAPPPGLPKLTSVAPPFEGIGAVALRRLLERIERPDDEPVTIELRCELSQGQTTANAEEAAYG